MKDLKSLQKLFGREKSEKNPLPLHQVPLMIIDDNPEVIKAFTHILEQEYTLIPCLSFEEAQAQLKKQIRAGTLPVILLDIKMAPKDGLEVFRLLKDIQPDLRIIFHSAYPGGHSHAREVATLPHAGYLTKGEYSIPELMSTIQAAILT